MGRFASLGRFFVAVVCDNLRHGLRIPSILCFECILASNMLRLLVACSLPLYGKTDGRQ